VVGIATMATCLAIQCVVLASLVRALLYMERQNLIRLSIVGASSLLSAFAAVILAGKLLQMAIWAGVFYGYGEFESFGAAFYHSVVNFSALGYGDLMMSEERRLMGALEAANGLLMFGLTTAFLYVVFWTDQPPSSGPRSLLVD